MSRLERWLMLFIIAIINSELFDIGDWEFWAISFLSGIATNPLKRKP